MWNSGSGGSSGQMTEAACPNKNEYVPAAKKSRKSSGKEALSQAFECCKNQELGIEEASAIYGVSKQSLRVKIKNENLSVIDEKYKVFVLGEFPLEAESDLKEHLHTLIASQISFSSVDIRRLGYELVCEKYKVAGLPEEKNCLLGQRWYKEFVEKYPHLNFEEPPKKTDQEISVSFFNALQRFVDKYNIDGSRIFSVEGIELKFRASSSDDTKVLQTKKIIYTDAKAICCASPVGIFVPPVFIKPQGNPFSKFINKSELLSFHKDKTKSHLDRICNRLNEICSSETLPTLNDLSEIQKEIKAHLNKKLQPMSEEREEELREKLHEQFTELRNKALIKFESSFYKVTHDIFYKWFLGFIDFIKPNPSKQVLLVLSDENYVKHLKTLELAKSNNVKFLVLPSHPNHKIYPLDGFAISLNRNLSTYASRWLAKNSDIKSKQVPYNALFRKAYSDTINATIVKNGFGYSGIWPINRSVFETTELGRENIFVRPEGGSKPLALESLDIVNEANIMKLCRVCMKEKMYMKPLFESVAPSKLSEPNYHGKKISEIVNMPISADDGLPTNICQYCLVLLNDTVKIRSLICESHQKQLKLREVLNELYFEENESGIKSFLSLLPCDVNVSNRTKLLHKILAKNFDISSICRICMAEKPLMTPIFYKPQGSLFSADTCTKITEVSQCQVHINDGLSLSICPFCRASINLASEFIQKASNSDKIFRDFLAHKMNNCD